MSDELFSGKEYGIGSPRIVAIVAGFNGKIADFALTARALEAANYDVVAYEYTTAVLNAGEAELLPQVISGITDDFAHRARDHAEVQHTGVSLGVATAWNMQKASGNIAEKGLYAAAGASVPRVIAANPLFKPARRAFKKNGYDKTSLEQMWAEFHQPPTTPFMLALGGLDFIVRYRGEMRRKVAIWQAAGVSVDPIVMRHKGHEGTIKWFKHSLPQLVKDSTSL